jgi:archaellum component FlaG (FlaF/FlaG flagellin family)
MADRLNFTTDDLSVTADGKVVISNPAVTRALVNSIRTLDPGSAGIFDNCDCSGRKKVSEVSLAGKMRAAPLALDLPIEQGIFDNCNCSG